MPSLPDDVLTILWQLDIIQDKPAGSDHARKPLGGMLFPYLFALAGAGIFFAYLRPLLESGQRFEAVTFFAAAMAIAAVAAGSQPFGLVSVITALAAAVPVGVVEIGKGAIEPLHAAIGLGVLAAVALASERDYVGELKPLHFHQWLLSPYALYGALAFLSGIYLVRQFESVDTVIALEAAGVVAAGLMMILHRGAFTVIAAGFLMWAAAFHVQAFQPAHPMAVDKAQIAAWLLVVVPLGMNVWFRGFKSLPVLTAIAGTACQVLSWGALLFYFKRQLPPDAFPFAVAASSFAYAGYGAGLRALASPLVAVAGILVATGRLIFVAYHARDLNWQIVAGTAAIALFWIGVERVLTSKKDALAEKANDLLDWQVQPDQLALAPIVFLAVTMLVMLYRIPQLAHMAPAWVTIDWFALAAALLVLSLPLRQRLYRYAGLAIIVLSLGRVFLIDMKEQDPLLRVAAFAVLGVGLLAISYGYFRWLSAVRQKTQE